MSRGLRWAAGFVLMTHGLVHLLVWPGAPLGAPGSDARLRWNGTSWSWEPSWLPPVAIRTVGGVLLAAAVLGFLTAGLALLGLPGARRFPLLTSGTGAACSLLMFGLSWPGLEPDPSEFATGPCLSTAVLGSVGLALLLRKWPGLLRGWPHRPAAGNLPGAPPPTNRTA
ncbi:hypothetical protein CcI49_16875 [Frankia sp. CcI49]|nr:hypothetical protein CcI49_16875 [Frankia sp. CcI49]